MRDFTYEHDADAQKTQDTVGNQYFRNCRFTRAVPKVPDSNDESSKAENEPWKYGTSHCYECLF